MKKYLLILFVLVSIAVNAQQKSFKIIWEGSKTLETSNASIIVPAFDEAHYDFNLNTGITFFSQWESPVLNESSATLSNVVYATISKAELKDVPLQTISSTPKLTISNSRARTTNYAYLEMSPIIKVNGIYKKVTAFTVTYNTNQNARSATSVTQSQAVVNSVLSSGEWYKFYIEKSGVFKLTKSFISQLGVNTNNVDPRNIKLYGNGGKMLPMPNDEFYPIDLTENAIEFVGEEDGEFDNADYILFYGEGPQGDVNDIAINTNINPYTDRAYYYINVGSGQGKRIQDLAQPAATPSVTFNTYHDFQFYEVDDFNLVKVGRRWFGDRFGVENEKEFEFSFPNLVTTEPARVRAYVGAVSDVSTSMSLELNSNVIATLGMQAIDDSVFASGNSFNGDVTLTSPDLVFKLTYNNNGNPASYGYLDYISVEATRELTFSNDQFFFKNNDVETLSGVAQYTISNSSNLSEVWDVTDKFNVTRVENTDNANDFSFKAEAGSAKTYLAVTQFDYFSPSRESSTSVTNQNLKGTIFNNSQGEFQDVDYLIIAPKMLVSQAQRLAAINEVQYGLNVKVVTLDEIYTEFSSGAQDISAIRNFVKYVYDNASNADSRLKYLCLFGDASYDYKDRLSYNTNIVPTWHSYDSFSLTSSLVSDDFFGMMDDNEGNMSTANKLDIAVGRILAETPQRATELVDKIEAYHSAASYGNWRNNIIVVSDDVDEAWENILQETTDDIGNLITAEKPFFNVVKIHADSYQQQSTSSGDSYPAVSDAIRNAIEVGALVINYFGHGGEDGLGGERLFDKNDSQDVNNTCKYNCFVTVTCEYTRFDDPGRPTAGEYVYWNKTGGSIGLLTTTRQIFVSVGVSFNLVLGQYLYDFNGNDHVSMAEALRLTKIHPSITGLTQKRLVFFIGDPAMKLSMPQTNVQLTKVNDVSITEETDVLQALGRAKLSGEVVDGSGNLLPNYNGVVTVTVFDKNIERQTLANDGTTQSGSLIKLDFETLGEILFKGQASVTNGLFDVEFVVPRDIGIPVGNGKVSFYATATNPLQDQAGASFDIQVGGVNENASEDNIGPVINLYMNDQNFVSGGITNEAPSVFAKLQDENGINTSSGIGHDITAIIDGDETNAYVLNDYYQANVDDYQNGEVLFPFRDLEPGLHTLTLKAWDVYNNSSTAEIQFIVHDEDEQLVITNVLNYPNPFVDYTEFWFNHNSSDNLDVSIQIFTVSGKLVKTINGQTLTEGCCNQGASSLSRSISWDGRDDFGDKIGKGVYVYKLKVRSNQLNKQVEKIQKLVILQ